MYFFIFFMIFMFLLNFYFSNIFFWWSTFLLITLVYLFLMKSKGSYSSMVNYFIIQESLGLFFLVFSGTFVQFLILMMKVGVSPFHFWIFSVVYNLDNFMIMWFLTLQKLPFIPVIIYLFNFFLVFFLFFGLLLCYLQIFVLKNFKLMFLISSTESFNWILFGIVLGIFSYLFIVLYYFLNMMILISYINNVNLSFLNLEVVFVFLNMPLMVNFFVKLFMLFSSFIFFDFMILIVLIMMFLSSLCFMNWLVNFSMSSLQIVKDNLKNYYFLSYFLFFLIFFYHFIKS